MRVHYLQHVSFESPAFIEEWLSANQIVVSSTHFYKPGYILPSVGEIDALLVMGGPMGIYDEQDYPWLAEEKQFIRDCVNAGKKILGICLGAQLLASVLGANVYPAPEKEIGWFPVMPVEPINLTEVDESKNWLAELFRSNPTVFHWHGDQFGIPPGCSNLLDSAANTNQAFYISPNIIGLQFHLEATAASLASMLDAGANELSAVGSGNRNRYIQSREKIEAGAGNIATANDLMARVLEKWLDLVSETSRNLSK